MAHSLSGLTLLTSNLNKIAEYKAFGLTGLAIAAGPDLAEVDGSPEEVILYKAISAGEGNVVEDAVFIVDGLPVVDIRWRVSAVDEWFGKPVVWEVRLGVNRGGKIEVYKGSVEGVLKPAAGEGFDYDPYFFIPHENMSLAQLKHVGKKDFYSARKRAADNLLLGNLEAVYVVDDVPAWDRGYQHS